MGELLSSVKALTVKHTKDFLHHLSQDEDVGVGVCRGSLLPMAGLLGNLAAFTLLDFGMGID